MRCPNADVAGIQSSTVQEFLGRVSSDPITEPVFKWNSTAFYLRSLPFDLPRRFLRIEQRRIVSREVRVLEQSSLSEALTTNGLEVLRRDFWPRRGGCLQKW